MQLDAFERMSMIAFVAWELCKHRLTDSLFSFLSSPTHSVGAPPLLDVDFRWLDDFICRKPTLKLILATATVNFDKE